MSHIIAIANQKGGTGKTTTTLNLGAALTQGGETVLLVDMDSQANCSSGLGVVLAGRDLSIKDVLLRDEEAEGITRETPIDGLYLMPSRLSLADIEMQLTTEIGGFRRLAVALSKEKDRYGHIIIDCPPSLGILCINGIVASDEIIIPMEGETYAMEGMEAFEGMLENISVAYGHKPFVLGILITKFRKGTTLHEGMLSTLRQKRPGGVFETVIRQNIEVASANVEKMPVVALRPDCRGAQDYIALADEVLNREKSRTSRDGEEIS